jgi:uncharacterized protein (DUF362 family)/Pyruvate/2-oxoacid:ferredoxin oxidoreductase delta subunit
MPFGRPDTSDINHRGDPTPSHITAGPPSAASRVAVVRCEGYDEDAVHQAAGRGLALLGGAERFVRPGELILLKPNLLVASPPERHVTTHPAVFRAVALHLQAAGARLSFGDSPGFGWMKGVAWRAGLLKVAEELGVAPADFSDGETVSFPEGRLIKQFVIATGALAADGIVSLPKFKTHGLTRLTGAVKNQLGCVPGLLKGEFHARMPDVDRFCQVLVDLNRLLRPRLYVMDGIVAMEGRGPRNGSPRPMSALLLSTDPVALDATACRMMDLNPALVPTNTWGEKWGLGRAHTVEILGDPLETFVTPDFQVNRRPVSTRGRRGRFSSFMQSWVIPRPSVWPANCTRCGTCVKVCPVTPKAITFQNGRTAPPVYNYDLCIRCYCCQEMCPEDAIRIQTPLLGRLIHR